MAEGNLPPDLGVSFKWLQDALPQSLLYQVVGKPGIYRYHGVIQGYQKHIVMGPAMGRE